MRIEEKTGSATIKRHFEIAGRCPVVDHPWSRSGKRVRIDRVVITYDWSGDGWKVTSTLSVDLAGPVLKKDGLPGKERFSSSPAFEWKKLDEYRWLWDLIADATPEHRLPYRRPVDGDR